MSAVARGAALRRAVPSGEVRARRAQAARELRAQLRASARMILLPAVDIRDGRAVRLRQGHFDDETVYADTPLEAARSFVEAGARFLHVVDLDGARAGEPASLGHLERITRELDVPVQYGGGLRSLASVRAALAAGAARVVLGTAAYNDPELLDRALETWGGRVVVAVDVRGGRVSVAGWTKETQTRGEDVIERLQRRGASRFVYTNVDRDGMLEGPDLDEVARISHAVRGRFIYSGGIGSVEDLRGAARAAAGEPGRRDLRQGSLRGPLHGPRGPGRARGGRLMLLRRVIPCLDVDKGRVVKGVEFVNLRDAGDPVELAVRYQEAGRRRDRVPRHHRVPREAGHGRRAGPPLRRRRVRAVHDRRRRALAGGRPCGARRGGGEGVRELGRGGAARAARRAGGGVRRPVRGARDRRPRRGRGLRRVRERRAHARWAATRSNGPARPWSAARGRYCSRAWTATAPRTATSCGSRARWPTPWTCP